jgi:hypothetical protein
MRRCAASCFASAYAQALLTPDDLRALPADFFTKPSEIHPYFCFFAIASDITNQAQHSALP